MEEPQSPGSGRPQHDVAAHGEQASEVSSRAGLALLAASTVLLLCGLGATDLWAPDEPRYAQVAEELRTLEHGAAGLLLLHLNGEVYTQKPPLYFWLAALIGSLGDHVSETGARLPSALAGIACIALVLALGRRLFPLLAPQRAEAACAGLWGAAVLVSVPRFVHQARRAQLDLLLTLFELITLFCFWSLWRELRDGGAQPDRHRVRRTLLVLHGATALAILTKGPVGLLPWLVIVVFLAWEGQLGELRRFFPSWGLLLALAPALIWLGAAMAIAPPGYFADAVLDNVLARYIAGTAHVRPFYYFGYQFPLDFLPWTPLLLVALVLAWRGTRGVPVLGAGPRERASWRFLLAWLLSMLAFFTLSSGKRGVYLLPAFPAAALLSGAALTRILQRPRQTRALELAAAGLLASIGAAALLLALLPEVPPLCAAAEIGLPRQPATVLAICAFGGLALLLLARHWGWAPQLRVGVFVAALLGIELATFTLLFPALDPEKSPRPIAVAASDITTQGDRIAVYRDRALAGGIEYYSGRRSIAIESAAELQRFFEAGDRIIVTNARQLPSLRQLTRTVIRAEARHGRRRLVLLEAHMEDAAAVSP